ncbi:MAG: vWA domain-containing protein [Pirellulaceae bacterium]
MHRPHYGWNQRASRHGAMLIMVAIVLVIILVGVVFSIDVAYMHLVRAELRTATDAAARAGAEELSRTQDESQAIAAAIAIGARNQVAGKPLELAAADVQLGGQELEVDGKFRFVPGLDPISAVRVNGRRDATSLSGPVPLFFAKVFGQSDFQPTQIATAVTTIRDIALVLDRSGSMAASAGGGLTRLDALKDAVEAFLNEVELTSPNAMVSLSTYSTSSSRDIALTDDFNRIMNSVDDLTANGLTAIGQGLLDGSFSLERDANRRAFANKSIVVMTDGNHNTGLGPDQTVSTAIARGQTVHTITFSAGANQALMKTVADLGGGIHVHADDAAELREAFQEIARAIGVLLVE